MQYYKEFRVKLSAMLFSFLQLPLIDVLGLELSKIWLEIMRMLMGK